MGSYLNNNSSLSFFAQMMGIEATGNLIESFKQPWQEAAGLAQGNQLVRDRAGFELQQNQNLVLLARTGTPINVHGHPLGTDLQAPSVIKRPEFSSVNRYTVLVPHGSAGLSCFEIEEMPAMGRVALDLAIESNRNRRVVEARDFIDSKTQSPAVVAPALCSSKPTPWNTFLCFDSSGSLMEYNPLSATAVMRSSLGNLPGAVSLAVSFTAGRRLKTILAGHGLCRVVSRQFYDARYPQANLNILNSGDAFYADFQTGKWVREPYGQSEKLNPELRPEFVSIAASDDTNIFYLATKQGRFLKLKDSGDGFTCTTLLESLRIRQIRYFDGALILVTQSPSGLWQVLLSSEKLMNFRLLYQ